MSELLYLDAVPHTTVAAVDRQTVEIEEMRLELARNQLVIEDLRSRLHESEHAESSAVSISIAPAPSPSLPAPSSPHSQRNLSSPLDIFVLPTPSTMPLPRDPRQTGMQIIYPLPSTMDSFPGRERSRMREGHRLRDWGASRSTALDAATLGLEWVNESGATALHVAAEMNQLEAAQHLIEDGADIDAPDLEGNSPLHYASSWGNLPLIKLFIDLGCQHSAMNNQGYTPLEYAFSFSVMKAMQEYTRLRLEAMKRSRRRGTQDGQRKDSGAPLPPGSQRATPTGSPNIAFSAIPYGSGIHDDGNYSPRPSFDATLSPLLPFPSQNHLPDSPSSPSPSTQTQSDLRTSLTTTISEGSPLARRFTDRSDSSSTSFEDKSLRTDHSVHSLHAYQGMASPSIDGGSMLATAGVAPTIVSQPSRRTSSFHSLRPTKSALFHLTTGNRYRSGSSASTTTMSDSAGTSSTANLSSPLSPRSRAGSTSALPTPLASLSIVSTPPVGPPISDGLPPRPVTANEMTAHSSMGSEVARIDLLSVDIDEEVKVRRGSTGRLARMVGFGRKKSVKE